MENDKTLPTCQICGSEMERSKLFKQSQSANGRKRYKCPYCDFIELDSTSREDAIINGYLDEE